MKLPTEIPEIYEHHGDFYYFNYKRCEVGSNEQRYDDYFRMEATSVEDWVKFATDVNNGVKRALKIYQEYLAWRLTR